MTGDTLKLIRWLTGQRPDAVWDVKRHRERRSLSQNGYYWQLVGKMADALRRPKEEIHNELLRSYGQPMYIAGKLVRLSIPDSEEAERDTLRAMTYHIRPTAQVLTGGNGETLRTYIMLRGSSEYDTKEMCSLLNGAVLEAQSIGIETLTPIELEAMYAAEHSSRR